MPAETKAILFLGYIPAFIFDAERLPVELSLPIAHLRFDATGFKRSAFRSQYYRFSPEHNHCHGQFIIQYNSSSLLEAQVLFSLQRKIMTYKK